MVTCGWYGKSSVRVSGPRRIKDSSSIVSSTPRDSWTNTTGEVGRKVPVPERCRTNGRHACAARVRCCSIAGMAAVSTGVGGSSVTCGQTRSAAGSPTRLRQLVNTVACGCGIAMATPSITCSDTGSASSEGQEPHPVVGGPQRSRRDWPGAAGPVREDAVQFARIVKQLTDPDPERLGKRDHGVGDRSLEYPVTLAGEVGLDLLDLALGDRGEHRAQVGHPGLALRVITHGTIRVGNRPFDLARDGSRLVEQIDRAGVAERLAHLRARVLQVENLRRLRRDERLGNGERLPVAGVEPLRESAGELEMLALVLTDGDALCLVEQDVRRLQHRVGEQAHAIVLGAVASCFVLELG